MDVFAAVPFVWEATPFVSDAEVVDPDEGVDEEEDEEFVEFELAAGDLEDLAAADFPLFFLLDFFASIFKPKKP